MEKKTRSRVMIAFLAVFLVAAAGIVMAILEKDSTATNEVVIRYNWTAPTSGVAVHHYVAEVYCENKDETLFVDNIPSETLEVTMERWNKYFVRVAGVGDNGKQGPWSDWSPVNNPELANPGF